MSRNRGKPTIRHLSSIAPTSEERNKLLEMALLAQPITTAILGAVFVEHELEQIIRNRLPKIDSETWGTLLQDNGPLATFNQKVLMGMALRIYDKETTGNLKIISNIRNAFAHSKRLIAFEHELVEKEIRKVSVPKFQKRAHREIRAMKYGAKGGYVIYATQDALTPHSLPNRAGFVSRKPRRLG